MMPHEGAAVLDRIVGKKTRVQAAASFRSTGRNLS